MHIVIAAGIFPPDIGGPATYARLLADYLATKGHTVTVVTYGVRQSSDEAKQYRLIRIPRSFIVIRYLHYLFALYSVTTNADLIYAQGPVAGGLPAYVISRIRHTPYVVKITGDYAWEQAAARFNYTSSVDVFQTETKLHPWVRFLKKVQQTVTAGGRARFFPRNYFFFFF